MKEIHNYVRDRSLELFAEKLSRQHYPDYPSTRFHLASPRAVEDISLTVPPGPWDTQPRDTPDYETQVALMHRGIELDGIGRPLHPWAREIVLHQSIGGLAGKGFYHDWGPNLTGDPVILRYDNDDPRILLVQRNDTGELALPGGFFDEGLDNDCVDTALREAWEETGLDFRELKEKTITTYTGPVADIRSTLHAWPITTVARLDLPDIVAGELPLEIETNNDEVHYAAWVRLSEAMEKLFGSHNVLVDISLRRFPSSRL